MICLPGFRCDINEQMLVGFRCFAWVECDYLVHCDAQNHALAKLWQGDSTHKLMYTDRKGILTYKDVSNSWANLDLSNLKINFKNVFFRCSSHIFIFFVDCNNNTTHKSASNILGENKRSAHIVHANEFIFSFPLLCYFCALLQLRSCVFRLIKVNVI